MERLDLDFSCTAKPYPTGLRMIALLAVILLLIAMWWCYQLAQEKLAAQQLRITQAQSQLSITNKNHDSVPAVTKQLALQTNQSLSLPWLSMLSALEEIKRKHDDISLLSVVPDKARSEVRLHGEAKEFEQITTFLDELKSHTTFSDAILLNQYLVVPDSNTENSGNPIYTFSLLLNWQR